MFTILNSDGQMSLDITITVTTYQSVFLFVQSSILKTSASTSLGLNEGRQHTYKWVDTTLIQTKIPRDFQIVTSD